MRARLVLVGLLVLSLLGICTADPAVAASDTTPPVLHSVSLASPGPFTAGDTVTVQWDATDDAGIMQVQVGYLDAVGHEKVVYANGAPSGQALIDYRWAEGPVTVRWVWVYDVNGNWSVYQPGGTFSTYPSGSGTHAVDLHAAEFTTQLTGQDVTAPVLDTLSMTTPATRTAGEPVTLAWTATDTHAFWFQALFVDAACKQHPLGGNSQSTGTSTLAVDSSWAEGAVQLVGVTLSDDSGNTRHYSPGGANRSGPGSNGPWTDGATSTFDLATMGFTTYSTGADTSPPVLGDIGLDASGPFSEGDTIGYHWSATDSSAITHFRVTLVDGTGKVHYATSTSPGTSATVTIDATWGFGAVQAREVELVDDHNNQVQYRRDGSRVSSPSCGSPGTHSFDLSQLDFQMQADQSADPTAPTAAVNAPTQPFTFLPSPVLAWSGTDSGSGVASYDVRLNTATVSQGFAGWTTPAAWQGLTTTSKAASLPYGGTVCFSVRARDNAGNVGAWSSYRCVTRHLSERALYRQGSWTYVYSQSLLGYEGLRSSHFGDSLSSVRTAVRRVGIVATTCPTCGTVGIYVGGVGVGKVSLVSSTLTHQRVLVLPAFSARSGVVSLKVLTSGRLVLLDGLLLSRV